MDVKAWYNKYCLDCDLKYSSEKTRKNYKNSVGMFLGYFEKEEQPKSIDTDKIKGWLLTFKTINTRNHKLCGIKSFYEITIGMPLKLDKIPFSKSASRS